MPVTPERIVNVTEVAKQVLDLVREAQESPNLPDSTSAVGTLSDLRDRINEIFDICGGFCRAARSQNEDLDLACRVVLEDVRIRIEACITRPGAVHDPSERVWAKDALAALSERIEWIQAAAQTAQIAIGGSASRSLWTSSSAAPEVLRLGSRDEGTIGGAAPSLMSTNQQALRRDVEDSLLSFPSMNDREEEVSEAHHRTFEWIFSDTLDAGNDQGRSRRRVPFRKWLDSDDHGRIYWINGKAGSGKSTLMRFAADHEKTTNGLRAWAGGSDLLMARFFFWTGGSVMQRSQTGLLRSLLHQILHQRRDLIPWVFPRLWLACQDTKKRVGMLMTWDEEELLRGLHETLQLSSNTAKICLFIDGLDEFEGDEGLVIKVIRDVVQISGRVKACISSRPWPAFERAFQDVPHIMLSDLTGPDMEQYVHDQLLRHPLAKEFLGSSNTEEMSAFKSTVLRQANGVFLWTSLALRAVLENVQVPNTISALRSYLLGLPSDLEDLFEYLLFHQRSTEQLQDQSHLLQIMRARDTVCDFTGDDSVRSMTVYQACLAFRGKSKETFGPMRPCDSDVVKKSCWTFAQLLHDRCSGLVVLTDPEKTKGRISTRIEALERQVIAVANRRIHYLHRTVRDFLVHSSTWVTIVKHQSPSFDAHLSLLRSHVLRLRSPLQGLEQHRRLDEWWHDDVVLAMTHARFATSETGSEQMELLDQFDATLNWYWRKRSNDPLDTWARHSFGTYEEREKHKTPFHHAFLSLAVKFGLANYLDEKLGSTEDFRYKAGIPLLSHALEFLVSRRQSIYPLSSPEVVRVLLKHGEDPNIRYQDMHNVSQTPWLLAIRYVREGKRRGWVRHFDIRPQGVVRWAEIIDALLDHGGEATAVIPRDALDPEITVAGVVEDVFDTYYTAPVRHLNARLIGRTCTVANRASYP
ncbi:Methylthioribose-1-phosphate isomerase [Sphaceloma murrayae]|uniref:Methylthioribose-1-phosphate isomerase n=1 Tax=Sphaceloma murrayae TaxID=2082308 RepID=A0A2K1QKF1_9PEZI|nr:Methylthioribose-1-phosphate isomerase [Sphaceloma murrayae]